MWHVCGTRAGSRRQSAEKLTGRARQQRRWGMSTGRRYSGWALLLLATFANLRFGELAGLRRNQIDLDACEVRVNASTSEMGDGPLIDGRSGEVNRAGPGGRALRRRRSGAVIQ